LDLLERVIRRNILLGLIAESASSCYKMCYKMTRCSEQPPKSVNYMGVGERGRNRTSNLLIKSQLLCQLSYAPTMKI
jgi:hypothetical protein